MCQLLITDAYDNPADDVDSFCDQIQSSVTAVLDALVEPLKTRTDTATSESISAL